MARKYHSLLLHDGDRWCIEFGDYSRQCVQDERDEYRQDHRASALRIITTGDQQADIDAAVAKLNNWRNGNV